MQKTYAIGGLIIVAALAGGSWWYWQEHHKLPAQAAGEQQAGTQHGGNRGGEGRRRGGRGDSNRPTPVLAAEIHKGDIRVVQTAVGTVVSPAVVTVRARVNGQLVRVLFKEGQTVRAGEVLAEIDPRPFQAQLDQALGQAVRNQALLRNSQIDLERYKTLQAQDSIATQQVDAQASLVQQYQGTVQADQGVVDNARLQLGFTRILSPISGRIGLRQVDVGNNITTTDALAVVNAVDPIEVLFTLPEDRVADLVQRLQQARKSGRGLPVEAWDRANTRLLAKGSLQSLDNQIDSTSGTIKLKAQFANRNGLLFPNQFVNVRLLSATLNDVTVAPQAAIQYGSNGAYVYRLTKDDKQGDRVEVQPINPGVAEGDLISVSQGLKPGDRVVVSGIDRLRDGARVTLASADGKREGRRGRHRGAGGDAAEPNVAERPAAAAEARPAADSANAETAPPRRLENWRNRDGNAGEHAASEGGDRPHGEGWKRRHAQADGTPDAAIQLRQPAAQ